MLKRATYILCLLFCVTCSFSQHFVGASLQTGTALTTIIPANNTYSQLRSPYNPVIDAGFVYRWDAEKVFGIQTGLNFRITNHRTFFPYTANWVSNAGHRLFGSPRPGFSAIKPELYFPLIFKFHSKFNKSAIRYTVSAGLSGMLTFNGSEIMGEAVNVNDRFDPDAISYSTTADIGQTKGMIHLGIGMEKALSEQSLISLELLYELGVSPSYTGRFDLYNQYVDFYGYMPITPVTADETYRFVSRNSGLTVKVSYLFATSYMHLASTK